jgi:hypothetical protein
MIKLRQFILLYGTAVFMVVLSDDLGIVKQNNLWWKYIDGLALAAFVFLFVKPSKTKHRNSAVQ